MEYELKIQNEYKIQNYISSRKYKPEENLWDWTLSKLKLCFVKDTFKRMKRQITNLEKTFVNHISDKGCTS